MTARGLAYVVRGVGRKIAKHHRAKQTPHGKQSVKKLMAHGASASSIELSGDTKLFDRVARKWNVDYAFYKTGPDKYLLFFKAGQADAIISWAEMYDTASMEAKKMIVNCLIKRVDVYRDYKLHIDFNIDFEQFCGGLDIVTIAA